jgi:radical SAM superfamily enzyme YgiQ (UPF0313 family)
MNTDYSKKLILINPRLSNLLFNFLQAGIVGNPVPCSLLTLAALTPKEYQIKIINQKQWWFQKDFVPGSLVGITCLTASVTEAYELADKFRAAGARVVLGGPHVSALPQEALAHADSVVIGEAESVWGQVIKDFEQGQLAKTYKGEALEDFFSPVYDYFLNLDVKMHRRSGIEIDRGCRYHCEFCARISQWLRFVKMEQVLGLIQRKKEIFKYPFSRKTIINFTTDNIYSNPAYAKELFKKMIPLNVVWASSCSIDIGFDDEALTLAKASGCFGFLIGFETTHPQDFKKTDLKQFHTLEDYLVAIKNIRAHGLRVVGNFIVGLDSQRHGDYLRLLWFLVRSRFHMLVLTILTPFPGSALFERFKKEERIFTFDWRRYFFLYCNFKPKHMSVIGVYFWYWFIRIVSVFFLPQTLMFMIIFYLGATLGDEIGRRFFYWLF